VHIINNTSSSFIGEIMPLLKGKKNIGHNIKVEEESGKKPKQAIAIALNVARKSGAKISPKKGK
jgi:hypothetical protein